MDSLNNAIPLWRKYLNLFHRSLTVTINGIKYSAIFTWKIKRWRRRNVKVEMIDIEKLWDYSEIKISLFKCQTSEVVARNIALDLEQFS